MCLLLPYLGHIFAKMVPMSHFLYKIQVNKSWMEELLVLLQFWLFFKRSPFDTCRCAPDPLHYKRKNMTAVGCWLVMDDEINTVLWLACRASYCSVTEYVTVLRCVLKNLPNNLRALTEWCSYQTSCAFSWSASVVSHWSSCLQWLQSVWLQSMQIS